MAEFQTLARPYARAAFEHAAATSALAPWGEGLQRLATLAADAQVAPLLGHPAVAVEQLVALFGDGLGADAPAGAANFVRLLAENGRLVLLPAIAEEFGRLRAAHERRQTVSVISAAQLDDSRQQAFVAALRKRLDMDVDVSWSVDPELIGGAVVTAGDLVIDGSVRGELQRLRSNLTQ